MHAGNTRAYKALRTLARAHGRSRLCCRANAACCQPFQLRHYRQHQPLCAAVSAHVRLLWPQVASKDKQVADARLRWQHDSQEGAKARARSFSGGVQVSKDKQV